MQVPTSRFLRWVLVADSATCLITGLLMILGSTVLARFLGLPSELLRYAGISLLPFTAFLVYLTSRETLSPAAIWTVIVLNVLWTADSFLIIATGWITPTEVGYAFVACQALGVAMFAGLEYVGLRKSAAAAAV
jgi:hypothetical protein